MGGRGFNKDKNTKKALKMKDVDKFCRFFGGYFFSVNLFAKPEQAEAPFSKGGGLGKERDLAAFEKKGENQGRRVQDEEKKSSLSHSRLNP